MDDLGTANQQLNGAFDWKQVGSDTWAARPSGGGGQALGVSLPINKDFTFQFDFYTVNDANIGTLLSGGDPTTSQNGNLKVRYGMPYITGADAGTLNTIHRITANTKHTWTIVCKKIASTVTSMANSILVHSVAMLVIKLALLTHGPISDAVLNI